MEPIPPDPNAPEGEPPLTLLLAVGELASIQIELMRILEWQAQGLPVPRNALMPDWLPFDDQQGSWRTIYALRRRAQVVLKWIAEQSDI